VRVPASAHAGRRFVVRATLPARTVSQAGSARSISLPALTCSAVLGGTPLRTVAKAVAPRQGTCVWKIGAHAQGRVLRGVVVLSGSAATVRRTFARRVR